METLKFLLTTTFYPPFHIGGDAIHVKYLAEELIKKGHEVQIFHSLDAYRSKRKVHPANIKKSAIRIHTVEEPFNLSSYAAYLFGNSFHVNREFKKIVSEYKPDIIHHHNISLLGYGLLKKRGRYINLFTAHDFWLVCQIHSLLRYKSEICESNACLLCTLRCGKVPQIWRSFKSFSTSIKNLDLLISPSDYFRRMIIQRLDIKSMTLPNFAPLPPTDFCEIPFCNYFLFVGALEIQKGIMDLLELFRQLGSKNGLKLVIAGDGGLRDCVCEFIRQNSLSSFVHYIGPINDKKKLYSLYKNAQAVIMPSVLVENAPLVALEAFSVGCPVIARNVAGLPEIVRKIDERLTFKNLSELREILLAFSRSEFTSEKIVNIYKQNFSPEIYLGKYLTKIHALSCQ